MTHCISIKNLYTKSQFNFTLKMDDVFFFLYRLFDYQKKGILFLYTFDDNTKYITAYDDDSFIIEKVEDGLGLKILEHVYDMNYYNKEYKVQSIASNVIKLSEKNNIKIPVDKEKLLNFIRSLDEEEYSEEGKEVLEARNKYMEELVKKEEVERKYKEKNIQTGGVIIWAFEQYLLPKMPSILQTIIGGLLEIIDIALIVLSEIPVAGYAFDLIAIVYCFLRFDMIGMFGAIIMLIPVIGGIVGGAIRVMGKVYKYFKKYKKYHKVQKYGTKAHKIVNKVQKYEPVIRTTTQQSIQEYARSTQPDIQKI